MRASSRQRLEALGIDVWVRRDRPLSSVRVDEARAQERQGAEGAQAGGVRVRLASGEGDWLLVQDAPWDGRHDRLLGDIQAAIGSARCRFGQWAHSESAGVSLDELESRGVRHVLVFGAVPEEAGRGGVHAAPALADLASRAQARRRLWQLLAGELGA
ncbi:MAG: hypothetical protein GVY32_12835 [Gammaproteobacteria bacterium]|jgi:hypothetical protein|nr:hypothetical protein [Gammaproteobacteria bacterium]